MFFLNQFKYFFNKFRLEFVNGGELFTHLCRKKKFELSSAKIIIAEIVVALENIHKVLHIFANLLLDIFLFLYVEFIIYIYIIF